MKTVLSVLLQAVLPALFRAFSEAVLNVMRYRDQLRDAMARGKAEAEAKAARQAVEAMEHMGDATLPDDAEALETLRKGKA